MKMVNNLRAQRKWLDEYARIPVIIWHNESLVTICNARNFRYSHDGRIFPSWYSRTIDIHSIKKMNLVLSYWGGAHIAHVFLTFNTVDDEWMAISIETRRRATQKWSALYGFFPVYPLIYVVGDERDLIGVRTDIRKERVYLYDLDVSAEICQQLFSEYLRKISKLNQYGEKYNSLKNNCTTNILNHARVISPVLRYNWRLLLSGHSDEYCFKKGLIKSELPFKKLKEMSLLKTGMLSSNYDDFSSAIRHFN